jgi:hypothetical protein
VNLGKTKNREGSEIRYLQGEIRRLNKIIRHLESQVKSHERHQHFYEVSQDDKEVAADTEDSTFEMKKLIRCEGDEGCGKGFFQEIVILDKVYGSCNVCERRKRLK